MISLMFMDNLILCYRFRLHDLIEQRFRLFRVELTPLWIVCALGQERFDPGVTEHKFKTR